MSVRACGACSGETRAFARGGVRFRAGRQRSSLQQLRWSPQQAAQAREREGACREAAREAGLEASRRVVHPLAEVPHAAAHRSHAERGARVVQDAVRTGLSAAAGRGGVRGLRLRAALPPSSTRNDARSAGNARTQRRSGCAPGAEGGEGSAGGRKRVARTRRRRLRRRPHPWSTFPAIARSRET